MSTQDSTGKIHHDPDIKVPNDIMSKSSIRNGKIQNNCFRFEKFSKYKASTTIT